MRAAIYCRVSTADQVDGTSLGEQERRCKRYVELKDWTLAAAPFVDQGISGTKADRPAWRAMLRAAEAGEIDVVVVTKLDRFSRSASHALTEIDALTSLGVQFVSLSESIDLTNPAGKLQLTVLAGVAEFERATIAQRGVDGQRAKAAAGRWPGGEAPYGYQREGRGRDVRIVPNPNEREVVRVATEAILDNGRTTGDAAALLNSLGFRGRRGSAWSHQMVHRMLESEALVGVVYWGKANRRYGHNTKLGADGKPKYGEPIRIDLEDPPMDRERWLALQRVLKGRGYGVKADAKPYPNSGSVTDCGGRLGGVWRRDRDLRQYRCNRSKWIAGNPPLCDCARINADWLDGRVWQAVTEVLSDPDRLLTLAADYIGLRREAERPEADTITQVQHRIDKLERSRVEKVAEYLRAGVAADVVAEAALRIDGEIAAARAYLAQLEAYRADAQAEQSRASALAELARRAAERLPLMDLHEQGEVLSLLRINVAVLDGNSNPSLRIEGVVPGGGGLFASPGVGGPTGTGGYPVDQGPRSSSSWRR
ncbi:recombinase family protein [Nocardioides sp. Arc9.136]|uniref:recombinase family protein n=1 Tax=Nocardioides sp. Arc9.136 TaxID=2996826 RepID=UPI0026663FFB|nr:recombinase family protein [Nocardioides sp. Arc9.136]WKN48848.1 recombinase family protein [Nocardioides sp. Arc9.136]